MKKILSVTIKHISDPYADTSFLGEYTDHVSDWAIVRLGEHAGKYVAELGENDCLPARGRESRFFVPCAGDEKPGSEDYKKCGLEDYERMESLNNGNWHFIGIRAEARITLGGDVIQKITSGGLWGIESDSGKEYLAEVEKTELSGLRLELLALGFSRNQIYRAFQRAESEDE